MELSRRREILDACYLNYSRKNQMVNEKMICVRLVHADTGIKVDVCESKFRRKNLDIAIQEMAKKLQEVEDGN